MLVVYSQQSKIPVDLNYLIIEDENHLLVHFNLGRCDYRS